YPFFSFHATSPTEIYTLSLHDALPICRLGVALGNHQPTLGYSTQHVGDERHLKRLELPELARIQLELRSPSDKMTDRAVFALRPDRKSTRLNSSHVAISYAVFCLKKKK